MQRAHYPKLSKLDAYFARDRSTQRRRLLICGGAVLLGAILWLPPVLQNFDDEVPVQSVAPMNDDPFAGMSHATSSENDRSQTAHRSLESGK